MKPVRKVVIPVAGFGTRFLPATKAMPKEMLPIIDKPVIQYIVEEAGSIRNYRCYFGDKPYQAPCRGSL
jgi:UTP-glucose-1-phosphate uridylyltransferase